MDMSTQENGIIEGFNAKIGVIIPVHNAANTLDICLRSVVEQEYRNLDIILVENGSIDNSLEICHKWEKTDKRIRVVQSDSGVSKARNRGLELVAGNDDYFAFIDADDYIDKSMYMELMTKAQQTQAELVFCNFTKILSEGKLEEKIISSAYKEKLRNKDLSAILYRGKKCVSPSIWRCLYKACLANLRFNEKLVLAEDTVFICEAIINAKGIDFVDKSLYYYYVPQDWSKYGIKDFYSYDILYYEAIKRLLYGRNKRLQKYVQLRCLLDRLRAVLITFPLNYREKVKEIYQIQFYKQARKLAGLLHLLIFEKSSFKSKLASMCLYLRMYRIYIKFVKLAPKRIKP